MEPISSDTDHLIVLSTLPCHTVYGEKPVPLSSRWNKNLHSTIPAFNHPNLLDTTLPMVTVHQPLKWATSGKPRGTCLKPTSSFERRRFHLLWGWDPGNGGRFGSGASKIPKFQRPQVPKTLAKDISFICHNLIPEGKSGWRWIP